MKEKIDKSDFIKIKNFHSVKDTVKRMKREAMTGKNKLQTTYPIKDRYPKYTKNS